MYEQATSIIKARPQFGTAAILAGGASSRMGFDKQMLQIDKRYIMSILIARLKSCFDEVIVVTNRPGLYKQARVRTTCDRYPAKGPLAGIHAALHSASSEAVFVVACDMPFLDVPYLKYLQARMRGQNYDACATLEGGRLQIFHGFYCRSALPALEEDLRNDLTSVKRCLGKLNTLVIAQEEAQRQMTVEQLFLNLNTREEYDLFARHHLTHFAGGRVDYI